MLLGLRESPNEFLDRKFDMQIQIDGANVALNENTVLNDCMFGIGPAAVHIRLGEGPNR